MLLAHQAARSGRTAPRPREALPRRLQACMHELLSANERYHATLAQRDALLAELAPLRQEAKELHTRLARSEGRAEALEAQLASSSQACEALREAQELSEARHASALGAKGELGSLLEACMAQLATQQEEIERLHRRARRCLLACRVPCNHRTLLY